MGLPAGDQEGRALDRPVFDLQSYRSFRIAKQGLVAATVRRGPFCSGLRSRVVNSRRGQPPPHLASVRSCDAGSRSSRAAAPALFLIHAFMDSCGPRRDLERMVDAAPAVMPSPGIPSPTERPRVRRPGADAARHQLAITAQTYLRWAPGFPGPRCSGPPPASRIPPARATSSESSRRILRCVRDRTYRRGNGSFGRANDG